MLFNSYGFIAVFLPVVFIAWFLLNMARLTLAAKAWLTIASLFFYGWWNVRYVPLMLGSIIFNFAIGTTFKKTGPGVKRYALVFGVCANLALLGWFKYAGFVVANINNLTNAGDEPLNILLPLGISFFTFTQIAYLVDAYRGSVKEYDLLNYTLFVTFFPHLLAGPIIHHKEMMPQFSAVRNKALNLRNVSLGIYLFSLGLFKKVIIADYFARRATDGFNMIERLTFLDGWVTSLSYTMQIYFDFSGYTDMAIASAIIFNIRLPVNFISPYMAVDIQDFWRRWHVTLSRFLRDYVYIPLGGNRADETRVLANLMITFVIGGIWHGAGWTFVFWGLLHGLALVATRLWKKLNRPLPTALAWFLTFNFINATWVFFRAKTWGHALEILKAMAGLNGAPIPRWLATKFVSLEKLGLIRGKAINVSDGRQALLMILVCITVCLMSKNTNEMSTAFRPSWKTAAIAVSAFTVSLTSFYRVTEFLYFNF